MCLQTQTPPGPSCRCGYHSLATQSATVPPASPPGSSGPHAPPTHLQHKEAVSSQRQLADQPPASCHRRLARPTPPTSAVLLHACPWPTSARPRPTHMPHCCMHTHVHAHAHTYVVLYAALLHAHTCTPTPLAHTYAVLLHARPTQAQLHATGLRCYCHWIVHTRQSHTSPHVLFMPLVRHTTTCTHISPTTTFYALSQILANCRLLLLLLLPTGPHRITPYQPRTGHHRRARPCPARQRPTCATLPHNHAHMLPTQHLHASTHADRLMATLSHMHACTQDRGPPSHLHLYPYVCARRASSDRAHRPMDTLVCPDVFATMSLQTRAQGPGLT